MSFLEGITWWQALLSALALAWLMQIAGTVLQMRHYRTVLGKVTSEHADGFMGAGNARGSLGAGVIAVIVASADGVVRKALLMEGRSVFASFKPDPSLEGLSLTALADHDFGPEGQGRKEAVLRAVEQITKAAARAEAESGTLAGAAA